MVTKWPDFLGGGDQLIGLIEVTVDQIMIFHFLQTALANVVRQGTCHSPVKYLPHHVDPKPLANCIMLVDVLRLTKIAGVSNKQKWPLVSMAQLIVHYFEVFVGNPSRPFVLAGSLVI